MDQEKNRTLTQVKSAENQDDLRKNRPVSDYSDQRGNKSANVSRERISGTKVMPITDLGNDENATLQGNGSSTKKMNLSLNEGENELQFDQPPMNDSKEIVEEHHQQSADNSHLKNTQEERAANKEMNRIRQQEEEDKVYRKTYALFYVHNRPQPVLYSKTSLFCLGPDNPFRHVFVWIIEWKWFENFITLCIILNSALLASTDYEDRLNPNHESEWTPTQEKIDNVFTWIFIVEAFLKIISMGFILNKKSYLRDPWNNLDFFIVCVSIVGMLPGVNSDSLKALRTFRILRPLRSINAMPTMKQLIQSLLGAIPGLANVLFFLAFIFSIFAIFGVSQYLGKHTQFCRVNPEPLYDANGNFISFEKHPDAEQLCFDDFSCEAMVGQGLGFCRTLYNMTGLDPVEYDDIRNTELIMYGIPNFDNFFNAIVTIFQVLTLESWSYLMYNYSDSADSTTSVIFFIMIVILGSFFTMNLVLAQIMDSFNAEQEAMEAAQKRLLQEQEREREHEEELAAEKAQKEQAKLEKMAQQNAQKADLKKTGENYNPILQDFEDNEGLRVRNNSNIENLSQIEKKPQSANNSEVVKDREILNQISPEQANASGSKENSGTLNITQFEDEEEHEQDARIRSYNNGLYRCLYVLVTSVTFNFTIFMLIVLNALTLAVYTYEDSDTKIFFVDICNEIFTWAFFSEMIFKLIGLGVKNYFRDGYNIFDCIIVVISMIDWTIAKIPSIDAGSALKAFKALRLLRMMKLSKSWPALADILSKTVKSLQDISSFSMLLGLFMFIFALLGMELFSKTAILDESGELILGRDNIQEYYNSGQAFSVPRDNFDNVGFAFTTVFTVIVGEDWNWTMYQWARAYSFYDNPDKPSSGAYWTVVLFFMLIMIMGNITLFSLFTAILLRNFEGGDENEEEEEKEKESSQMSRLSLTQRLVNKQAWSDCFEGFQQAFGKKKRKTKQTKAPSTDQMFEISPESQRKMVKANEAMKEKVNVDENPFENAISMQKEQGLEQIGNQDKKISHFQQEAQNQSDISPRKSAGAKASARRSRLSKTQSNPLHYDHSHVGVLGRSSIFDAKAAQTKKKFQLEGSSLFCFGPTNCLRKICYAIASHSIFETIILILIVISTITLALETPLDDPKGKLIQVLGYIDYFMTSAFVLEALLKIISYGFALNGKNSYIREPWNILDFTIVLSALTGIIAGDQIDISFIKALRILRIMRPLRLIARNEGLKVAITSLFNSIPSIINLQVIVLFFIFLIAILQTTLFSGTFNRCYTDHLDLGLALQREHIKTQWDCLNYGGEWVKPDLNFDDTLRSMLTLMTIQTTEGWIGVMWDSVDAVNPYYQPVENNNVFMIIYMIIIVIIICMLFLNLFVGVVIETFNREKEMLSYNQLLKGPQKSWIKVQLLSYDVKPVQSLELQGHGAFRMFFIKMTSHKYFDGTIMTLIILNTLVLAFNWYMQPTYYETPLEYINYFFMIAFTLEAVFKLIAMRASYFKESWNIFDFTVVVLTIVILLLVNVFGIGKSLGMTSTILRTLRIGRVFRLVKKAKKLQVIFEALISSAPAMGSLGLLLMLLMFMFSIIGISVFSMVNLEGADEMGVHVHFQTFGTAFLALMRCSTGEAWNSIMFESARPRSILYQCEEDESYESIIARGEDPTNIWSAKGCGPTYVAYGFHILFQILVSQIFLNLFIAIIIDSFFGQNDLANLPIQERQIQAYPIIWSKYDPKATGFIDILQLSNLLQDIAEDEDAKELISWPDKLAKDSPDPQFVKRFMMNLEIPIYTTKTPQANTTKAEKTQPLVQVMFYDVLQQLCNLVVKVYHNKDLIRENKAGLKVAKILKGGTLADDSLEAVCLKNVDDDFSVDLDELMGQMSQTNNKIQLIKQLKEKAAKLHNEYNDKVDTNIDCNPQLLEDGTRDIVVFNTRHYINAQMITEIYRDYKRGVLKERKAGNIDEEIIRAESQVSKEDNLSHSGRQGLADIKEVDSIHEKSNLANKVKSQQTSEERQDEHISEVKEFRGILEPDRALESEQFSLDQDDFDVNGYTAFHNDKKHLK